MVAGAYQGGIFESNPAELLDLLESFFQGRAETQGGVCSRFFRSLVSEHKKNPVAFVMEPIITVFIFHPEENKDKAGHSESKAYKIESGIFFLHLDLAKEESYMIPQKLGSEAF